MTRAAPARSKKQPVADDEARDEALRLIAEERADSMLAAIRPNLVRLLMEHGAPNAAVDHVVRWPLKTDGKSVITLHAFARWGGI